jgi:hypothetical protein
MEACLSADRDDKIAKLADAVAVCGWTRLFGVIKEKAVCKTEFYYSVPGDPAEHLEQRALRNTWNHAGFLWLRIQLWLQHFTYNLEYQFHLYLVEKIIIIESHYCLITFFTILCLLSSISSSKYIPAGNKFKDIMLLPGFRTPCRIT